MIKKIYEFLLWDNCRNNCKFCFVKQYPVLLDDSQKNRSIDAVMKFIDSDRFIKGSHVLLVGGELFDSPSMHDNLIRLFKFVISKMLSGDIDLLYVNTNLIYKKTDCLVQVLTLIKDANLLPRLKFTTSYDFDGRFTDKTECLMLSNLRLIRDKFPDLNIVINMMLSNLACNKILDGTFDISEFSKKYNVYFNLIPYIILDNSITANQSKIFKVLKHVDTLMPGYLAGYVLNINLKQDRILYKYDPKDDALVYSSCKVSDCGHSENFKKYSTKGTCFACDLNSLFENILL